MADLIVAPPQVATPAAANMPVSLSTGHWWLVHTRSRNEKALAADLERRRIECFLPLVRARRRYQGRTFEVRLPLFPSYLFLCGGEDERYATLMTHRAAGVIPVVDQEQLRHELRQVYLAVNSDQQLDLFRGLKTGRRCRVISGPLAGLEGVVLRRRDLCRVYLGVQALGQSAELEIDPALLEVLD